MVPGVLVVLPMVWVYRKLDYPERTRRRGRPLLEEYDPRTGPGEMVCCGSAAERGTQ